MKKINISLIVVILLISVNTNAQYSVKKNQLRTLNITSQPVYYATKQLSEKQEKQYQRWGILESKKELYNSENTFLKKIITEKWEDKELIELSSTELASKIKSKDDVWYISLRKHTDKFFDRRVVKKNYYYNFSHYEISLFKNKKEVLTIPLVDEQLSELNAEFAIQQIQSFINKAEGFKNLHAYAQKVNTQASKLKGKTILVSENLTEYPKEYLQKFFDDNIEVVNEARILKAVREKDSGKAYLLITINDYSKKPSFNHLIIDCATNEPLLVYRNSSAFSKSCKHNCSVHRHNEKLEYLFGFHFKKYQKMIKF